MIHQGVNCMCTLTPFKSLQWYSCNNAQLHDTMLPLYTKMAWTNTMTYGQNLRVNPNIYSDLEHRVTAESALNHYTIGRMKPRCHWCNGWQDGSMHSCCLHQILTLLSKCCNRIQDSSEQITFFQSFIVQYWTSVNFSFLFLADRSSNPCGFLLLCQVQRFMCSETPFCLNSVTIWVTIAFLALSSLAILR